jgi:DNA-binding response OmpR family regulator
MAIHEAGPPSTSPRRVMVIDDNPGGRRALARYLEIQGFEVCQFGDGTSALRAFDSGPPPDVVLTDMMLPDMDGREIGRRARQLEPRPLVALLTGWSVDPGEGDLDTWGIDLVFLKPIDLNDLLDKIRA